MTQDLREVIQLWHCPDCGRDVLWLSHNCPEAERRRRNARFDALAEAWDQGWAALAAEYAAQRQDPSHPITRANPYRRNTQD